MSKKMIVDEDLCIGCGVCASLCPKSFEMNEEGKSKVIGSGDDDCDQEMVVGSCPVGAIKIEE